jgi:Ti-type conjugative transfer relaxase TraA
LPAPHFSVSIIARGSGRSAVLSAAYRHCARMSFEREGRSIDYTRKQGLLHEEFMIPADAPAWLRDLVADRSASEASEAFWNVVEKAEKRVDAQLARDVTIALPIELSAEQNIALMRDFVERHVLPLGMVADWVYHDAPGNPHVHLMASLRPLAENGLGPKKRPLLAPSGAPLRDASGKILYENWSGGVADFNVFREGWFACQNRHLAQAGLDIVIDGRSYERQGVMLSPTIHLGVGATAIRRKSEAQPRLVQPSIRLDRVATQEALRAENRQRIARNPAILLDLVTREKSVFDERDIAKALHRYVDDPALFSNLLTRTLQSPEALRLERERIEFSTGLRQPARYTTRSLIRLEWEMAERAVHLSGKLAHKVRAAALERALRRHETLSSEQRAALSHLVAARGLAAVIGRAGAGKTTMMKAAREAWEGGGYRVVGGALAGKAAEGLQREAGIGARTLAAWDMRWREGRDPLDRRTIFVLDEAGMVSSRQMASLVERAAKAGAKLVLIGDPDQLQPIEAGAAFRAIAERVGYAELDTIYRQHQAWMRAASMHLARGRVTAALAAYRLQERIVGANLKSEAMARLIDDWSRDYDPSKTSLILAHLRRDVRQLNENARSKLIDRGLISPGHRFATEDGERFFSGGDQIIFLKNDSHLDVKNGMLGRVVEASEGRMLVDLLDQGRGRRVQIDQAKYSNIDHGYATTIHKSQGATVDRVKVLATLSLDRHLAYVALTRHREDLHLYFGRRSFAKAGGLDAVLSRRNAKETTLDYRQSSFYRQALVFAQSRGLHLARVARTLLNDRLEWTLRQRQRLLELTARLSSLAACFKRGVGPEADDRASPRREKPMLGPVTHFPKSIDQHVEERLAAEPSLTRLWQSVTDRFHRVYADPQTAFRALDLDRLVERPDAAPSVLEQLATRPEQFGVLRGRNGLTASRADRQDRQNAIANAPALARNLKRYLDTRHRAAQSYREEERAWRNRASIEIPAISIAAKDVLERIRDAIDRNDLPAALQFALADKQVKAELDGLARAVAQRFGDKALLAREASDPAGATFNALAKDMGPVQRQEAQAAWGAMRAVQQLAHHEQRLSAERPSEALRQTRSKGITWQ